MNLLLGPGGKIAMGIVALAVLIMLVAGVLIWILPLGSLRSKLLFKRHAAAPRRIYDIHKLVGLLSFPVLMVSMLTAAIICLPGPSHTLLGFLAPLTSPPAVQSRPRAGAARLSIDQALLIGAEHFPGARTVWVRVPQSPFDPYDLQMRQSGAPMTRFPRTHVWLDQFNGQMLAVHDPRQDNLSDTVLNWVQPLHDGKAFGLIGRIIILITGLAPLVLLVSGAIRWLYKRRSKRSGSMQRLRRNTPRVGS